MKKKMVLIEWVDSNIIHGWRESQDVVEDRIACCQTIGYLEREDNEKVVLIMGISNYGLVFECITIPKGCIKSIRILRIK